MKFKFIILLALLFTYTSELLANLEKVAVQRFPAPSTMSQQLQSLVSDDPVPFWNDHPKTNREWNHWITAIADRTLQALPALKKQMQVNVIPTQLGNVKAFIAMPKTISPDNQNRVLLHFHGGGYVLNPGEAGTDEAIMMAGYGQIKVISVDYRMAPDFPFPAAVDDALMAYSALLKQYPAENIGVFGTSTGGGMVFALMLNAKHHGLALPSAIVTGTPWTDLSKTGDSYFTHEGIDNVLVSYDGWLGDAAKLYAGDHDLKEPLLSPIYGEVDSFPPTLLITGTRDLFLSNTIRMHLKLKDAGVTADLVVLEGISHAQYLMIPDSPEAQRYFNETSQFFNRYLAN